MFKAWWVDENGQKVYLEGDFEWPDEGWDAIRAAGKMPGVATGINRAGIDFPAPDPSFRRSESYTLRSGETLTLPGPTVVLED